MVLTKDEYEKERAAFLSKYSDEIKKLLIDNRKQHLEEAMRNNNWKYFFREYMGGFNLVLIVAFFAFAKDVFSIYEIFGFILVELFIMGFVYSAWKNEIKQSELYAFSIESQLIVQQFVYNKMISAVNDSQNEEDFNKVIQFYSVALYEIPRNELFINVFRDI